MPLYPSKCCGLRSVPRLLPLPLFSTWTHIWVLWGVRNVSTWAKHNLEENCPASLTEAIMKVEDFSDTQDSPWPGPRGRHHSILCGWPRSLHPNGFSLPGFSSENFEVAPTKTPQLWSPITLQADLGSWCDLKQTCNSCWELSNDMSHALWNQVNQVDSGRFLVESQIVSQP